MGTILIVLVFAILIALIIRLANKLEKLSQDLTTFKTEVYNPEGIFRAPITKLSNSSDKLSEEMHHKISDLQGEDKSLRKLVENNINEREQLSTKVANLVRDTPTIEYFNGVIKDLQSEMHKQPETPQTQECAPTLDMFNEAISALSTKIEALTKELETLKTTPAPTNKVIQNKRKR